MKVSDSTIVVTGAASGLGEATCRALMDQGAQVVGTDRVPEPALSGMRYIPADIRDEGQLREVFAEASSTHGALRGVVHCAGRGGDRVRVLDREGHPGSLETFREVIETNLIGTYNVLRLGAEAMARNEPIDGERGAIIFTASVAAFEGQIGQASYAASKAGVHGMVLVAARDLSSWGIRVNAIAPGIFDTPMLARLPENVRASLGEMVPFPSRLGRPEEFADLACQILGNGYLNGQTIRLDGAIRMAPR